MARILVTGGAGFIGSNLVEELLKEKHQVIVVDDLSRGSLENLKEVSLNDNFTFIKLDITEYYKLRDVFVFEKPKYVIHLAALARVQPSIKDPMLYHDVNVTGTLNLLELSSIHRVKKFVFASSSSVYGDNKVPFKEDMYPHCVSPYAMNKFIGELYCSLYSIIYGLPTICFRFFNVYGKNMLKGQYGTVMGIFADQIKNNKPLTINGDGTNRRAYTYVGDIVDGLIKGMKTDHEGIYNLGTPHNYSVNEIAKMMLRTRGIDWIEYPIENLPEVLEPKETKASVKKAWDDLRWLPTNALSEKIEEVWK